MVDTPHTNMTQFIVLSSSNDIDRTLAGPFELDDLMSFIRYRTSKSNSKTDPKTYFNVFVCSTKNPLYNRTFDHPHIKITYTELWNSDTQSTDSLYTLADHDYYLTEEKLRVHLKSCDPRDFA